MTFHRARNLLFGVVCILVSTAVFAQPAASPVKITSINSGTTAGFRGLSVVNARVIWASGTAGTVGRSLDGGKSWQWQHTSACDACDWRSIAALSADEAFIINAGSPARLLHTKDGGKTWEQQYYNADTAAFFDCLRFANATTGFAVGDPIGDHFTALGTDDGGKTWKEFSNQMPPAPKGEAIFAASNSNIVFLDHHLPAFITGGQQARFHFYTLPTISRDTSRGPRPKQIFKTTAPVWFSVNLPILHGQAATGAFAVDFLDKNTGIVTGGDYAHDTLRTENCALTTDGGQHWTPATTPPFGYRSGVTYISTNWLAATGTSGTDFSADGGQNWVHISKESFNTIKKLGDGHHAILAGGHGKIAILEVPAAKKNK